MAVRKSAGTSPVRTNDVTMTVITPAGTVYNANKGLQDGNWSGTGGLPNTGEYTDMYKAGIIDPVKVVRTALSNAASIAALLLTTEAMVTNLEKEDKDKRRVEGSVR